MNPSDPYGLLLTLFDQLEEGLEEIPDASLLELDETLYADVPGTSPTQVGERGQGPLASR